MEVWQLQQLQSLSLRAKVARTERKIREWYNHWQGDVCVSVSGKDSTALLHIVRQLYPKVRGVFVDTGLEYPEIRDHIKTLDNVEWLKPQLTFVEAIEKYGYPVISKEVSQKLHEIRTTKSSKLLHKRLHGDGNKYKSGKLPEKWKGLIDAPFKISHKCCDALKKRPIARFEKRTGLHCMVGTRAESHLRIQSWCRHGCNAFTLKRLVSRPLPHWLEDDIWAYIRQHNIPYAKIYDMGESETGCMFCAFGAHREPEPNRFQRMYRTHPVLWRYCMDKLGLRQVLGYIGIPHTPNEKGGRG